MKKNKKKVEYINCFTGEIYNKEEKQQLQRTCSSLQIVFDFLFPIVFLPSEKMGLKNFANKCVFLCLCGAVIQGLKEAIQAHHHRRVLNMHVE